MKGRELHITGPHGAQRVLLSEDDTKPENRIYLLHDDEDRELPILGSELEDLLTWWEEEKTREGIYEEPGGNYLARWPRSSARPH